MDTRKNAIVMYVNDGDYTTEVVIAIPESRAVKTKHLIDSAYMKLRGLYENRNGKKPKASHRKI